MQFDGNLDRGRYGWSLLLTLGALLAWCSFLPAAVWADNPDDPSSGDDAVPAQARDATETLLPAVTKSFLSIPDFTSLREAWNKTQFGKLMNDPLMKPFVDSLDEQVDAKLSETGTRLGLSWSDIRDVYGGEICFASMQPPGEKPTENYAMAVLVDVTGKDKPVDDLLKKIDANMAARKAARSDTTLSGADVVVYELPRKPRVRVRQKAYIAVHDNWLLATDQESMAEDILQRINGTNQEPSLADLNAFGEVMKRSAEMAGDAPRHLRFFLEPFGMMEVAKAARNAGRRSRTRKPDRLAAFRRQGFDSVEGFGGLVTFASGEEAVEKDVLYHAFIYAPEDKRVKAAQMLDFPNNGIKIPAWTPVDAGSVVTINWRIEKAFDSLEPLVNELMGDDVWAEIISSIEKDRNGPQINLKEDLVVHLKDQLTVMTDIKEPIEGDSERIVVAIEVKDSEAVKTTIRKTFERDPHATPRPYKGAMIYDIKDPNDDDRLLNHMSLVVHNGALLIGTSSEYLKKVMDSESNDAMAKSDVYIEVENVLKELGANGDAVQGFNNRQRSMKVNYELIRQNKLPGASTMLAKMLDSMYPTGDEAVPREPRIDGGKLPPFANVKDYFRPSGFYLHSSEAGWSVKGFVLP